jgi:predicted nucleotidyltransferase
MSPVDRHHQHLQQLWAEEQRLLEQRRQRLVAAAALAARALRQRWPVVRGVWLFGSARSPEAFRRHSDLDLAVEGLPEEAHLQAIGEVERVVDPALAAAGESGIAIDVVRSEDLPPHWRERLREQALPLL